jgi:hypothetical protein
MGNQASIVLKEEGIMDRRELISVLREAFDKQVKSHHALDMRSRELDYYRHADTTG